MGIGIGRSSNCFLDVVLQPSVFLPLTIDLNLLIVAFDILICMGEKNRVHSLLFNLVSKTIKMQSNK